MKVRISGTVDGPRRLEGRLQGLDLTLATH